MIRIDRDLIHRGFATDEQILNRYKLYKDKGQAGPLLDRLIDEENLTVKKLRKEIQPDWYLVADDTSPLEKPRIKNIK